MEASEKIVGFWARFCASNEVDPATPHQVWYFGNTPEMARELAELVIAGKKIATASLAAVNEKLPEDAPVPNGISIVTDFFGEPMCVIRTVELREVPFNEVDARFAFDEGEGDRSLGYWREVHWNYFSREAEALGIGLNKRSPVCCERFKLLFP